EAQVQVGLIEDARNQVAGGSALFQIRQPSAKRESLRSPAYVQPADFEGEPRAGLVLPRGLGVLQALLVDAEAVADRPTAGLLHAYQHPSVRAASFGVLVRDLHLGKDPQLGKAPLASQHFPLP